MSSGSVNVNLRETVFQGIDHGSSLFRFHISFEFGRVGFLINLGNGVGRVELTQIIILILFALRRLIRFLLIDLNQHTGFQAVFDLVGSLFNWCDLSGIQLKPGIWDNENAGTDIFIVNMIPPSALNTKFHSSQNIRTGNT